LADLFVTNLAGQSEMLTDFNNLTRKRRVNGERSLSFFMMKTPSNTHAFPLVCEESIVEYGGDQYRIKNVDERTVVNTPVKDVTATHVFFDIVDVYQYGTLTNGAKSISQALSFALSGTGWTFSVIDAFGTVQFENFGDDNALALFQTILERFSAEFDISGTNINIRTKIGSTPDFQFRYKHNVKTLSRTVNTNDLSTYIKGYGKQNDDGTYTCTAEYTSPMADVYGIRHAPPVKDERFTVQASLLSHIQSAIVDTPEVSIELEFVELQNAGFTVTAPGLGDTVPTIYEPLSVDLDLRILEIEDYPESTKSPRVALSNVRQTFADVQFNRTKAILDKLWDENSGRIRYNVYTEAVKKATEALNNSLTELEYPEGMGIIARDPNDASRFVALRSAGLGITTNGGETFDNAITADGVTTNLLTAGQIKTNNIQIIGNDDLFYWDGNYLMAIDAADPNKYVKLNSDGLYTAKGSLTIERPDGYKVILDGKANFDLNVQGGTPQYVDDSTFGDGTFVVTQQGPYTRTSSTAYVRFDYFRFKHTSRYLNLAFYARGGGAGAYAYVRVEDSDGTVLATNMTNATSDTNVPITIDLGVPTGAEKVFYAKIKTTDNGYPCLVRLATKYMNG